MADPSSWLKFSSSTNLPVTVLRGGEKQVIYINAANLSAKIMPNLGIKPDMKIKTKTWLKMKWVK